jgi:hypothetical protein
MSAVLKPKVLAGLVIVCGLIFLAGCKSSPPDSRIVIAPADTSAPSIPKAPFQPAETIQRPPPLSSSDTLGANILVWDAKMKKGNPDPGEEKVEFTFTLTNVSPAELVIYATETTCECTVANLPSNPWLVPPGGSGQIHVTLNLHGKQGTLSKGVTVFTSKGNSLLTVEAVAPVPQPGMGGAR